MRRVKRVRQVKRVRRVKLVRRVRRVKQMRRVRREAREGGSVADFQRLLRRRARVRIPSGTAISLRSRSFDCSSREGLPVCIDVLRTSLAAPNPVGQPDP